MAFFRGDGMRCIEQGIREKDLARKVGLIEDGLVLHFRELEQVFNTLGLENFSELGLRELTARIRGEDE